MFGLNENNNNAKPTNSNTDAASIGHAQSAMPGNPFNEEDEIGQPMTTAPPDPVISPQGPPPDPVPMPPPTLPANLQPPVMPEPPAPVSLPTANTPASKPDDLLELKEEALHSLQPLVGHLDQTPEEKFKTTMMLIQATDNSSLVKEAYEAANRISDEKTRAQALLDVVNEINYFTQHQSGETEPKL